MKKIFCMALSAALLAGSMPAYAAEAFVKTPHIFTAKVGTTQFTKDGKAQPLDVPVYMKDGYVMLPLRTFMKALDENALLYWEEGIGLAQAQVFDCSLSFEISGNRIWKDNKQLPVFGQMEVKDGRVFVPLRDWEGILKSCSNLIVDADALRWDGKTKTATVQLTELLAPEVASVVKGSGEAAVFGILPTERYDEIESVGGDFFIAKKYVSVEGELSGAPQGYTNWQADWFVLNRQGQVLRRYDSNEVRLLRDWDDGFLRLDKTDGTSFVLDQEGNTQFAVNYAIMGGFSDGLALVCSREAEKWGYINTKGELVIPLAFSGGSDFSEGLAAMDASAENEEIRLGYIDKAGNWVIPPKYSRANAFSEGLAAVAVETENGEQRWGYIDRAGNWVAEPQFKSVQPFYEGVAAAMKADGTIVCMDKNGKTLKTVAVAKDMQDCGNGIFSARIAERITASRVEYVTQYFDKNGRISERDAEWRKQLSEGLAPCLDEKTGKYGYVGEDGAWVIAPAFDTARAFRDGYAVVAKQVLLPNGKLDVQWGTICHPL
nr:WG repeat-containing protein [uncultured Anaerotignum sp.]